jgi:hypothetical protein
MSGTLGAVSSRGDVRGKRRFRLRQDLKVVTPGGLFTLRSLLKKGISKFMQRGIRGESHLNALIDGAQQIVNNEHCFNACN